MAVIARLRSWISLHPRLVVVLVGSVSLLVAAQLVDGIRDLRATTASWGTTATAWQSITAAEAGTALDVRRVEVPLALYPSTAVDLDPSGAIARRTVGAGELVVAADLGRSLLDLLPSGWRAVTVDLDPAPPIEIGDRVDVAAGGRLLTADALVIALDDGDFDMLRVTIALPGTSAPAVADAASRRDVSLLLRRD